ncbi:transcriptional regulator, LacI family [Leptothrix cholodnii SP-6]|uniref:Transcriptional regulator, LacI family n=1 Tax=Leptothrix cholodnii (strain ATCC 51168 / LMG 8142 / SP-6) TaxID=395495 RepID=B1XZL3_LEPCP|nr:substrate-binding domain-containing protein [Leptothrix cholodnii]ACB36576.1 transcriptional regulator, LacI family [Leptothrix cholodnii SP-6]
MATIKDVARLAGVGIGTASRAISGRGAVAPETLARVQQAVRELDFRPSHTARALSLRTQGMLGVYVPHFEGSFYGPILGAIDAELRAVDRHMVAANGCGHGDRRQQALDGVDFLIQRECDGVLVLSNDLTDDDVIELQRRCERLVLLNRRVPAIAAHCFTTDHGQAGRLAARALLQRGHRDIATISGPHNAPDNEARMAGFRDELAQHGVKLKRAHQVDGDFMIASGALAARELLMSPRRAYTAVFCANDQMAMGAISAFFQAGLCVPDDLSVIGFDDSAIAAYSTPPLTTVRIPIESVAVNGCRFLINLCYGLALPVQREFPSGVVWRQSVGDGPHLRKAPRDLDIPIAA